MSLSEKELTDKLKNTDLNDYQFSIFYQLWVSLFAKAANLLQLQGKSIDNLERLPNSTIKEVAPMSASFEGQRFNIIFIIEDGRFQIEKIRIFNHPAEFNTEEWLDLFFKLYN